MLDESPHHAEVGERAVGSPVGSQKDGNGCKAKSQQATCSLVSTGMAEFLSGQRRNAWVGADRKKWAREEEAKRRIGEIGRSLPIFPSRLELAILAARCCVARPLSQPKAAASSQGGSPKCSRADIGTSSAASSSIIEALDTAAEGRDFSSASLPTRIKPRAGSSTASITKDELDLGVAGLEEVGIAHESVVGNVLVYSAEARVAAWILTYGIPPANPALVQVPVQAPPTSKADSGSPAAAQAPRRIRTIVTFYHAALGNEAAGFENILGDWLSGTDLTTVDSTFSQQHRHAGPRVHVGVYNMWRAVHAKVEQCLFRIRNHCENCAQQLILTGSSLPSVCPRDLNHIDVTDDSREIMLPLFIRSNHQCRKSWTISRPRIRHGK